MINLHMPQKVYEDILHVEGANYAGWEAFDWWLRLYKTYNPDDERSDLELIDEYVKDIDP